MRNGKIKKALALCLALCLTMGSIPTVSAVEVANPGVSMPYTLYIGDQSCSLTISGKTAKVKAWVEGYSGEATKCKVYAILQRLSEQGTWVLVDSWGDQQNGTRASVSETATVTTGTTYRVKATVTVWAGDEYETMTIYSDSVMA